MRIIRLGKAALVASIALFFTLVAFGNVTDYDSNWQFVRHVLSMDTTFPESTLRWRAVTSPAVQTAGYWLIIAWQAVTAVILWAGAVGLVRLADSPDFAKAKAVAAAGLILGFLLYAVGFIAIGGEWFAMWQSEIWNGQQKAFEFLTMISAVLVILLLPEPAEPM